MSTCEPKPTVTKWDVPFPYGYAAAIDSMGSISAPLLAATSTALLGFVLTLSDKIQWSNAALFLLMGATFAFVSAVQLTFWAKRFVVTPDELTQWWPSLTEAQVSERQWEQRFHYGRFNLWAIRARTSYNLGILLLLAALPVMLVPTIPVKQGLLDVNHVRLAAVALAIVAFIAEAAWIILAVRRPKMFDPIGSVK